MKCFIGNVQSSDVIYHDTGQLTDVSQISLKQRSISNCHNRTNDSILEFK